MDDVRKGNEIYFGEEGEWEMGWVVEDPARSTPHALLGPTLHTKLHLPPFVDEFVVTG